MYAKKNADKKIDIKSLTLLNYLNNDRTVYLAENKSSGDQRKRYMVKVIPIPSDPPQFQTSQQAIIKKMFTSSIYYFKPQFYDFKDNYLHLCMKVQPLSLQTLIWIHKKQGQLFSGVFIRDFTVRLFEGIARLKSTQIFPQNLKPSNIFLQIKSLEDKNWVWSEAGLHTVKRSQFYYKINMQNIGKNNSIKVDPFQMQFYSLAIMLVQMITLQSPYDIDKTLRATGKLDGVQNFNQAEEYYGVRLIQIIKLLIQPPKDNSLAKAIQEYKQSQDEEDSQMPNYDDYGITQDRLQSFIKDQLLQKIDKMARDYIRDKNLSSRDVFDKMTLLDPEFHFSFSGIKEFQELLDYIGIIVLKSELIYLSTFFTAMSQIKYFKLIQSIFPAKQLIQNIISKAAENYDSFKQFFESQASGKDFWKVEEIKSFLESLEVPFLQKDIVDAVKEWTKGSSKTSIKYSQIYAAFKPIMGLGKSLLNFKKPNATVQGFNDSRTILKIMMQKLKKKIQQDKGEDLISFFRKNDIKQNWTVDSKIYKIIKNYTKDKDFDDEKYKKAFLQMQKQGSIEGDLTKQINYVFLIRNLELQEPLYLYRQVITQKINESNREAFFAKYQKRQNSWTFQSLQQFNKDQGLQFTDIQLKALFSEIDSDRSGAIQMKELFYKLTNVKQFDYGFIIETVKQKIQKEGIYLFKYFEQVDPRARLVLSNSGQLHNILQKLGVQLSLDHLTQLYNKFAKKDRFDYLAFCRQFHPIQKIFMSSIRFILTQHYKGSFDKLYQMGLKQNKKKWSMQSLSIINQEMVLGFRQSELKQIWKIYDPNDQGSLTKQEVAHIFNYQFVQTSELTTRTLESIKDLPKKKQVKQEISSKKQLGPKTDRKQKTQSSLIQSFKKLEQLNTICLKLIDTSSDKNGIISIQQCISFFQDSGIQQNRKQLEKLFLRFNIQWTKKPSINFIQFFFFLIDQIYIDKQQMIPKSKASLALQIIKEIKKLKKITNSEIFQWCRYKDKMRFRDFQEIINKLTDVEIFSADIQHIWSHWGQRDFFTQQDFDNLLQTKEHKQPKMDKQKSEKEKQPNLRLQKKQSNNPKIRLAQQNKMIDFINEAEGSYTPFLKKPLSFGEKDPTFRKQSSNRNSYRQSLNQKDAHDTPINKFKAQSTQRQRQIKGLQKKKSLFPSKKNNQQKLELQQFNNPILDKSKKQQKFNKTTYSKNQLLQKFRQEVTDVGENYINELFSKANIIQVKRFVSCLTIHYHFSEEQGSQLGQHISKFDKIKLDTLKQYLYKSNDSPEKNAKDKGKSKQKFYKNKPSLSNSPSNFKKEAEGKKIIDPRRQKINIPLVKETIKSMKTQFCKRFEINEFEPYFFSSKDNIIRQQFITKCQSISTKLSTNTYQKIFDYLKPDNQDKISILSFKLGMGLDEPVDEQQDDYLPEQLEKELKYVFEKADRDHSGFIEPNQIEQLLASLGLNENIKEIQNYFERMDQNFDNRISYNQFRRFIEEQILPQMSDFDEDQQQLQEILKNNDIFRSGCLAATTFHAVIERYGVKISQIEVQILVRQLNPEGTQINIRDFLNAVRDPYIYQGKVKGVLYKIRLRKKVQLKEIQKIFENISSCFVLAYTPAAMQKQILNISSPYRPVLHQSGLFYNDLNIRDAKKLGQTEEGLVGGQIGKNDILVQIAFKQVNGVPIPQKNEIKTNIVRRYVNISLFDLSAQVLKSSIWQIQAQFDPQAEDVWRFSNTYRSIFIKVAEYQPRKYEKIVLLFQLVIDYVEGNRTLEINCGCSNMPLRQLMIPQGKAAKKLKLIAGLPNRSKEIDKNAVSKRSGWKNFFGGDIQSELQLQLVHQNKFKQYHRMLAALPSQVILGRKALHYLWTYRQTMAENAFEGTNVNALLSSDMRIISFRLSLDIPEAFGKVWLWWKDKVQSKVKSFSDVKRVFKILMQQLYLIFNAKQFELIKKCPCKVTIHNKSLSAARNKMINEALENVQNWINIGVTTSYKRKKNYNFNYGPFQMHETDMPKQHRNFMENIAKLIAK